MLIRFAKVVDAEPVAIAADQIARVHGRRGPDGKLFCEVYVIGGKRPIGVLERFDQVEALLCEAGVKVVAAAGVRGRPASDRRSDPAPPRECPE